MDVDVLVVGSGPAGLQAAIYASRRKLKATVLGKIRESNISKTKIENLLCIEGVMAGTELLYYAKRKAETSGARFIEEDAMEINKANNFIVKTESDLEIDAKALVIATGIKRSRLGVKGEKDYIGKGVAYCADCDAPFFKDKDVAVAGCGSAAANAALLVKGYTDQVYLICERLNIDKKLRESIESSGVKILEQSSITEIRGDTSVKNIILKNGEILNVEGVLIELGAKGVLQLLIKLNANMDENKHIIVDRMQRTNIPGLYAAGDICGPPYQVAKAIGEGCIAGINASQYVRDFSH